MNVRYVVDMLTLPLRLKNAAMDYGLLAFGEPRPNHCHKLKRRSRRISFM